MVRFKFDTDLRCHVFKSGKCWRMVIQLFGLKLCLLVIVCVTLLFHLCQNEVLIIFVTECVVKIYFMCVLCIIKFYENIVILSSE
jgi:hypothetical protein